MKTKFLLMAVSCIALLSFTSCEKEEMGVGGTGGGTGNDTSIGYSSYNSKIAVPRNLADTTNNSNFKLPSTDLDPSNNLNTSNKFNN